MNAEYRDLLPVIVEREQAVLPDGFDTWGLSGADLTGVILRGADLRGADLRGADLTKVDLTEADLTVEQARERGAIL